MWPHWVEIGTPAGSTEVWGGPLANGCLVAALSNRAAPNGTLVTAPVSVLLERRAFFSFAMLAGPSARAAGYARGVPAPAAETAMAQATYQLRDVLAGKDVGPVTASGTIAANVAAGDTKLFTLRAT